MAELGTLVMNLQANTAQFHSEIGKARDGLEQTGRHFGGAERAAVSFAVKGLGPVIPALEGVSHSLGALVSKALAAGGAMRILGETGLIVGGVLAVAYAFQRLQAELKNYAELGELIATTDAKRAKAHANEVLMITVEGNFRRQQAKIAADALKEKLALEETNLKEIRDRRDDQIKAWQTETAAFIEQLKARLTARQAFEQQLGTGAMGLGLETSASGGHKAALDFQESITRAARDQAFLERDMSQTDAIESREQVLQGVIAKGEALKQAYAGFPSVIAAIDKSLSVVQWGNFGLQVENARKFVDKFIATSGELDTSLGRLNAGFASGLPTALTMSTSATGALTNEMVVLKAWIEATTQSVLQLNAALAGSE